MGEFPKFDYASPGGFAPPLDASDDPAAADAAWGVLAGQARLLDDPSDQTLRDVQGGLRGHPEAGAIVARDQARLRALDKAERRDLEAGDRRQVLDRLATGLTKRAIAAPDPQDQDWASRRVEAAVRVAVMSGVIDEATGMAMIGRHHLEVDRGLVEDLLRLDPARAKAALLDDGTFPFLPADERAMFKRRADARARGLSRHHRRLDAVVAAETDAADGVADQSRAILLAIGLKRGTATLADVEDARAQDAISDDQRRDLLAEFERLAGEREITSKQLARVTAARDREVTLDPASHGDRAAADAYLEVALPAWAELPPEEHAAQIASFIRDTAMVPPVLDDKIMTVFRAGAPGLQVALADALVDLRDASPKALADVPTLALVQAVAIHVLAKNGAAPEQAVLLVAPTLQGARPNDLAAAHDGETLQYTLGRVFARIAPHVPGMWPVAGPEPTGPTFTDRAWNLPGELDPAIVWHRARAAIARAMRDHDRTEAGTIIDGVLKRLADYGFTLDELQALATPQAG